MHDDWERFEHTIYDDTCTAAWKAFCSSSSIHSLLLVSMAKVISGQCKFTKYQDINDGIWTIDIKMSQYKDHFISNA